jgi:hypothetical protein
MRIARNLAAAGVLWAAAAIQTAELRADDSCEYMRDNCSEGFYYWNQCEWDGSFTYGLHSCGTGGSQYWCRWDMPVGCSG